MTHPATFPSDVRQAIVSFVIPALNEERYIRRCLESISQLTLPARVSGVEVIVVDNESTDRTADICRELGARVVSTPPGRASRARNRGASIASGEWVAFLDADCEATRDWLVQCITPFSDPNVVAVGGCVLPPEEATSWVTRALGHMGQSNRPASAKSVRWLATAGLVVRKCSFIEINGFDERLATCEDCDLGYRLSALGLLLQLPYAAIYHYGESSSLREIFLREAWRSRDNLRLAVSRPHDIRNWASLTLPIVYVVLLVAGLLGVISSSITGGSIVAWSLLLAAALLIPTLIRLLRDGWSHPMELAQTSLILSAYFLGRAAGIFLPFRRLERNA